MKAIREGVEYVIPLNICKMLGWQLMETRATGSKSLDLDKLKSISSYNVRENYINLNPNRVAALLMSLSRTSGESWRASMMKRDPCT
jgi:hypothetical protein